jgi:amidohydrolase
MMANADEFEITIHGRGGHAAYPQACVDPILIASQVVVALQSIASRNTAPQDSVVITVSKIEGGTAFNIIPDRVTLLGTIRTLSEKSQNRVFERIEAIASGIAHSMEARAEVKITRGYPVLSNHPSAVDYLQSVFEKMENPVTQANCPFPQMVGEDFAYFARKIPACFFGIGLKPSGAESYPQLHQADFDFNDEALPVGMRCFSELVLNYWD